MFPSIFNLDENIKVKSRLPSDHQNPNPNFLFNFPSPFLDEHESPLNQIFFQTLHDHSSYPPTQNMTTTTTTTDPEKRDATKRSSKDVEKEASSRIRRSLGPVARRRTGKKDRHSKICTAQGVRDRRMRLSLQVARKFFDLQDMLGYDKASKTIEWLFTKSKKAIRDLVNDHTSDVKSESFLSECEVVSGSINDDDNSNKDALVKEERGPKSSTREMARARARSRTKEKMMEKCLNPNSNAPFQGPYDTSADVGTIEKFLQGNSSSSSPISWPNSETSSAVDFMGFFGNWDNLLNADRSSSIFSVTDQVSLAGNPSDEFP